MEAKLQCPRCGNANPSRMTWQQEERTFTDYSILRYDDGVLHLKASSYHDDPNFEAIPETGEFVCDECSEHWRPQSEPTIEYGEEPEGKRR